MTAAPDPRFENAQWFIRRGSEQFGPYSWPELGAAARAGRIGASDLVSNSAGLPWTVASRVSGLAGANGAALGSVSVLGMAVPKTAVAIGAIAVTATLATGGIVAAGAVLRDDASGTAGGQTDAAAGESGGASYGAATATNEQVVALAGYDPTGLTGDYVLMVDHEKYVGERLFELQRWELSLTIGPAAVDEAAGTAQAAARAVDHQGNEFTGTWVYPSARPDLNAGEIELIGGAAGSIILGVSPDHAYGDVPDQPIVTRGIVMGNGLMRSAPETFVKGSVYDSDSWFAGYPVFDVNHFRGQDGFGTTADVPLVEPQD